MSYHTINHILRKLFSLARTTRFYFRTHSVCQLTALRTVLRLGLPPLFHVYRKQRDLGGVFAHTLYMLFFLKKSETSSKKALQL